MLVSSVSSKGQVVIPKALRDQLGLRPGTQLRFEAEGGALRVTVLSRGEQPSSIAEGLGLAGYSGPRISDEDIRAAARSRALRRG